MATGVYTLIEGERYCAMCKKISKKIMIAVIVSASIVLLIIGFLGFLGGFYPLEHNIIIRNATRYVIETHGLTPTEVRITTLYLWFPVTVRIETEENDFWFQLRTGRFFYGRRHFSDNYLDQLAMSILTRELRTYVESITDGQGIVWASFGGGILPELRRDDVNIIDDPNSVFEILRRRYQIGMWFYSDLNDIDFDFIYNVYSHVLGLGLEPRSLSFSFGGRDEKVFQESHLRATIDKSQESYSLTVTFTNIYEIDNIDYDFIHDVYYNIVKRIGLEPRRATFIIFNNDDRGRLALWLSVAIDEPEINSPDELIPLFREERQRRRNQFN